MITGELKRLTRNRVFLIITAAIILANIVMIMYCANMSDTSPIFSEYMNELQQEYKMYRLSYSTVNGRRKLELAKAKCAVMVAAVLFVAFQIPWLVGYRSAAPIECLKQRLSLLYEPQINSEMTIMALLGIVILIRLIIFAVIFILTYVLCRRSRSEFVSAVFMCALLIVICLVLYYMKLNLTRLILNLTTEWRQI